MTVRSDDFNRIDESPLANSTWENITAAGCRISSNQVIGSSGVSCSAWLESNFNFADDQSASCDIYTPGEADNAGVGVRLASTGGGRGYIALYNHGDGRIYVSRLDAGVLTTLSAPVVTWNSGDSLTLTVTGSTLEIFQNGVSRGTAEDSTYTTGGQPGVFYQFDNINATKIDDWQGEDGSSAGVSLTVDNGVITLSSQDISLVATGNALIPVTNASLSLSGADVLFAYTSPWDEGALTLTGQDVTIIAGLSVTLGVTEVTLSLAGQSVTLTADEDYTLEVTNASLTVTGQNVTFSVGGNIAVSVENGSMTVSGVDVGLNLSVSLPTSGSGRRSRKRALRNLINIGR